MAWFVLLTLIRRIVIYPVDSVIQPLNTFHLHKIHFCVPFLKVFVNGDMREEVKGQGLLSLDWGGKAGIGMKL